MTEFETTGSGAARTADDSPYAFRYPNYVRFWSTRLANSFANQIIGVSVGWQVYDLTRSTFALGMIGLVTFAPAALLVLVTGQTADRFRRRHIMAVAALVQSLVALGLIAFTLLPGPKPVWPVYVGLLALGTARAFYIPASSSMVTSLLPPVALSNGITWLSSSWQLSMILGPVAGGLLYGIDPMAAYGTGLMLFAAGFAVILTVGESARPKPREVSLDALLAGFRYIWSEKVVLGAISLDLFAVLLGGATALLPAIARDVLDAGPLGLGFLRGAPGIGAIVVAFTLSLRPIRNYAGRIMFAGVALFGLGTILFGLSTAVWLSVVALIVMGGADVISVTVRETLIQLWTPDEVRGRVNAVNSVFVGASNELGEFRAGIMASVIGVMPAVIVGGVGTVAVAGLWSLLFPGLLRIRSLENRGEERRGLAG